MMATEVLSFRLEAADVRFLRKQGLNPNEFARQAAEAMLRRLRAERTVTKLADAKWRLPRPVEDVVREMRDSR